MGKLLLPALLIFSFACGPGHNTATYQALPASDQAKFEKYLILGQAIYTRKCQNCHQANGQGLRGLIPPLAGADFLQHHQHRIPCLLKFGASDSITVNNRVYAPQMPHHPLTNLELAEVITYINNSWGNEYGFVTVRQVDAWLQDCSR